MKQVDARRLTGPNLQTQIPGAVTEVAFTKGDDPQQLYAQWQAHLKALCAHLPFDAEATIARFYDKGAAWILLGPIDRLYAIILACEYAIEMIVAEQEGRSGPDLQETITAVMAEYEEEQCPRLLEIEQAAQAHHVPFLWDDDFVTVGYGKKSITWPERDLPEVNDIPWDTLGDIPVVLITGTNGKTTTSRLLARMVRCAGLVPGNSSTDGVFINEEMVEEGDWTGPGAARTILRRKDVDVAVLEAARGGILRRGLGVNACNAALVTNVANDHLGDYGILTVPQMAKAKGVVYSVVPESGCRIFNMDDDHTASLLTDEKSPALLTSVKGRITSLDAHHTQGGPILYFDGTHIFYEKGSHRKEIVDVVSCPISMNGAALYNISNMLNAIGLAIALDLPHPAIVDALHTFGRYWKDNPGRGQMTDVNGVKVFLDFGHNPHGAAAVLEMVNQLLKQQTSPSRFSVSVGQAGDRSDADLQELSESIAKAHPNRVYLRDMKNYLRGREELEVPKIMTRYLLEMGVPEDEVRLCDSELDCLIEALEWAQPGDVVVHLVHTARGPIKAHLESLEAQVD
jgi:cyanophycin synthetase